MELIVGKHYNKGMYLGNTEDLYIDGGELSGDGRNVFLRDDCIYDIGDTDILEDSGDMLPGVIIYDGISYLLSISTCVASNIVFRLEYITNENIIYSDDGESINELIRKFHDNKNSIGYPKEIRYIYTRGIFVP